MTMPENLGHDPDRAGALRGAMVIVVVGVALGIGYNAMGLASRPRHGLAWIKQPEKIESLEAMQGAPAPPSAAAETSMPAPGPGDAVAATMETAAATPSTSASSSGSTSAKHDSTSAAKTKSKSKSSKTADPHASSQGSKGTSAPASGAASAPASGSAASTPAPAAPAAGSTGTAPADLPTIPDVTGPLKVEMATFKKLYDAGAALVIDAREKEEYTDGHIAGATSLPYNDAMAEPDKVKKLDAAGKPIVVYCSGGDCELSMDLAKLLVENGKRKVLVYEGGFPEWSGAGYAVTKGEKP